MPGSTPARPGPSDPGPGTGVRLWLVRHGETELSRAGRHTGTSDPDLTDHGRAQAAALRPRLEQVAFAAVLCSPLRRARQTLAAALPDAGSPVEIVDDLREWEYGDAEGRTTAEMQAVDPGWSVWTHASGGETARDVGERADRAIERALAAADAPETGPDPVAVLLVAHGHLLRILAARWTEQPAAFGSRLGLDVGGTCVLGHDHERRVLRRWNAGG